MEKQSSPPPPPPSPSPQLSPQDWDFLLDDFSSGDLSRRSRWLHLPLLDLALLSILRRDFPSSLKPLLLLFLEDSLPVLPLPTPPLPSLLDALRSIDSSLKDQFLISTTSIAISVLSSPPLSPSSASDLASLTELLLAVANRPSHGPDRQTRAVACECLRELETAFPGLLSDVAGHVWELAQAERTHAAQSYLLLLAVVARNVVQFGLLASNVSIFSTATPLVPLNVPQLLLFPASESFDTNPAPSDVNLREIKRLVAFLMERSQALTPAATMELVATLVGIVGAVEAWVPAVPALLKVQFSGLLYSYDPILCHVVLMLYCRFSDVFAGDDESGIARRLAFIAKEAYQPLVFRLLALHWLLGSPRLANGENSLIPLVPCFYPAVFDPLALKVKKLDALARVAARIDASSGEKKDMVVVKLFEDGLVCVSTFKWLPPWSTETSVAFRAFHKLLVEVVPHSIDASDSSDSSWFGALLESTIFNNLQCVLVRLALEHRGLVPVIAAFIDRLLGCEAHRRVGEQLLQTLDERLLPKLEEGYQLSSYFSLFEKIAQNDTVPPRGLLGLLTKHMTWLAKKHGPDTGLRSWSQGSKVLGICRTMLKHHHSSRVFRPLSCLLGYTCQSFPDLEVRDNARIYLRMLACIPGKKLRHILGIGEQSSSVSSSPHPGSLFQVPSPRVARDLKKSSGVASYIHLERVVPLLVKQSWSLTLPNLSIQSNGGSSSGGFQDISSSPSLQSEKEIDVSIEKISKQKEPLRVMDSEVAEILGVLRRHFSCIPDYRYMPGIKIRIRCILRFEAEPFSRIWGSASASRTEVVDELPAMYATTITFSSTSKFGKIPPCRVPFLIGEPAIGGLDLVPVDNNSREDSNYLALVLIELEPREPMPGLIDVAIEANAENGQIISGPLQSITVGIEDMFLRVTVPPDIPEYGVTEYYADLFHALWEACGDSANTGRETFPLSGGKGSAAIYGTRSVKLLEVSADSLIRAVERHLAPFVVTVVGDPLVNSVRANGMIRDIVWEEDGSDFSVHEGDALVPYSQSMPLQLQFIENETNLENPPLMNKRHIGLFHVLIFLPPRFHLLFLMEVGDTSTLVRIRTDHWPCLAYVDEYLEALL
ncbi:uncharacterized protein [Typha angustifolia]|uniref:uncharacterized protein n=1 Tax=Typha angustifolia TaxID=59011 RepID=UPI003C2D3A10